MSIEAPERGFIFWPVGTGDSTTIRVDEDAFLQIDLRHMAKSDDDDDPAWPVIDELIEILPSSNGKPFLSTFALTHPDEDHCKGFADLNERAFISELWMSPRTFREFKENEDLCKDAEAFHEEAMRRVKATIDVGGDPGSGDRIRIIGYDTLLKEDDFNGFPEEFLSVPGHAITRLDDTDLEGVFAAFVHAPFKDDSYGDRNDCSLAFQITLQNGEGVGQALLMGDLTYAVVRRIFDSSDEDTLSWNVLLAPHHCSKSVMYWQSDDDVEEKLKSDIVRDMGNAALDPGYVVASSMPVPPRNDPGDNPPHAKAKAQYERIVPNEFICTHEHPPGDGTRPVIFQVTEAGFAYVGEGGSSESLDKTLKSVGGAAAVPATGTGFGSDTL